MAKRVDLSTIIVSYNTENLLRNCLETIKRSETDGYLFETVVVDNASTDGSVEMMKRRFPKVKLVVNKKNIGFAAANNMGIRHARGRYLLFLNPDTIVQPNTLRIMVEFMDKHPQVGTATCRVELPSGELDYSCHRGFPTPWSALAYFSGLAKVFPKVKFFAGYPLSYLPFDKTHEIDSACGAFLIVRRKAGEEVNWWDEDYFWYGEDLDFCFRLQNKGWKIVFVPKTKIIHYKGASSGIKKESQKITTADRQTKKKAAKASTDVMRIFFEKHYKERYPKPIYWLVMRGIDLLEKVRLARYLL